jgi:hypothetical protein
MSPIRKTLAVDDDDDVLRLCKVSLQTFTDDIEAALRDAEALAGSAIHHVLGGRAGS